MEVKVNVTFNYGGWTLWFSKVIDFSVTPFIGMWIDDSNEEVENYFELANNNYCTTMISYKTDINSLSIDVRNSWGKGTSIENVDETIERFIQTGWEREDSTNEKSMKDVMLNGYR